MQINSKNYEEALERRDEIEQLLDKAYGIAFHLQDMYNELDEDIENYNKEQNGLDD